MRCCRDRNSLNRSRVSILNGSRTPKSREIFQAISVKHVSLPASASSTRTAATHGRDGAYICGQNNPSKQCLLEIDGVQELTELNNGNSWVHNPHPDQEQGEGGTIDESSDDCSFGLRGLS
jgi:hypothetical protein